MPARVAYCIDSLSRAGTESQLLALIHHIDRREVVPHLALLDGRSEASRELEPADCPVLRLGVSRLASVGGARAGFRLSAWLRRNRIDIVQAYFHDSVRLALPVARLSGVRAIVRVQNNDGYSLTAFRRRELRALAPLIDVTLTNADAAREAIVEQRLAPAARVRVLENGVDLGRFDGVPPLDGVTAVRRIGLVGNLRPVKNVAGLVRAASLLADEFPEVRVEVAGEGPERGSLERLIADTGLTGRVTLVGSVSDVPGFLARQHVAVLCSHSEGMSNALLEYQAAGRAVVATDVGAARRLLDGGRTGVLVPPGDDAALADALAGVMRDARGAAQLGAAARAWVASEFGRAALCGRFVELYRDLLSSGASGRTSRSSGRPRAWSCPPSTAAGAG